MKEMVSETGVNPNKGTFGTSISFDIDEAPKPVRRKGREKHNQSENNATKPGEISNGWNVWLDLFLVLMISKSATR